MGFLSDYLQEKRLRKQQKDEEITQVHYEALVHQVEERLDSNILEFHNRYPGIYHPWYPREAIKRMQSTMADRGILVTLFQHDLQTPSGHYENTVTFRIERTKKAQQELDTKTVINYVSKATDEELHKLGLKRIKNERECTDADRRDAVGTSGMLGTAYVSSDVGGMEIL